MAPGILTDCQKSGSATFLNQLAARCSAGFFCCEREKSHVCGLKGVFRDVHAAAKNKYDSFAAAAAKRYEVF